MKKIILSLVVIVLCIFCTTGCDNSKLSEIANKFNESSAIKSYEENGYYFKATANANSIAVSVTQQDQTPVNFSFKVENDILSASFSTSDETALFKIFSALYMIDAIGQTNGYKDGEMLQSLNDEKILTYTFENEGLYIKSTDEVFEIKVDINKKVPLVDFSDVYITVEDLIDAKELLQEGSYNMQRGNVRMSVSTYDGTSEIIIIEKDELTSNSYNSLLSAVQVIFDSAKAPKYIQSKYDNLEVGNKSFGGVTIDTDYELDEETLATFKDEAVKAMKVTIKHKTFKKNIK